MTLRRNLQIQTLAADLGIRGADHPVRAILRFCENRAHHVLKKFPDCNTLEDLLIAVADDLGTQFVEIWSDEDLEQVRKRFVHEGERIFAGLHDELSEDVYGITVRRTARKRWEKPYVSVIDCRGDKQYRSYFTKWHEIGHLLILTDQMRLCFRRTHVHHDKKDPEEQMVDLIAGTVGFLPRIVRLHARGLPTLEKFEELRSVLCPDASKKASNIGFTNAWPTPCLLIQAKPGFNRNEHEWLAHPSLGLGPDPKPVLRAVKVSLNDAARKSGLMVFRNMRVPEASVIHRMYSEQNPEPQTSSEDLSWWESSGGTRLPHGRILVQAVSLNGEVVALVHPN